MMRREANKDAMIRPRYHHGFEKGIRFKAVNKPENHSIILPRSQTPFLPKSSLHTIHRVYLQECNSLLPKGIGNNMTFLFQKCDTFDGTAKGRTWLASQDHPDFTQQIWSSSIKIHIVDSQKLNYLKNKAITFGRNSHLLVSNPLFPMQRHLDLFNPSEPNPLLPMQRHLGNTD